MPIQRRARDANGNIIEPMTLAWCRALGIRSVDATCDRCRYQATINAERWPDEMPVPDVGLRLRCSRCGSREIETRPNWLEYRASGMGGPGRDRVRKDGVYRVSRS